MWLICGPSHEHPINENNAFTCSLSTVHISHLLPTVTKKHRQLIQHYDLPDLLHACFHHANTHMRLSAAPKMMNALYQNSCFYITAMQLLDSIYEYIDPHGGEFFARTEYLELYESVFTTLLSRKTLQVSELRKFKAMHDWARQQIVNKRQHNQQFLTKPSSTDQDKSTIIDYDIAQQQQQQQTSVTTAAAAVAFAATASSSSMTTTCMVNPTSFVSTTANETTATEPATSALDPFELLNSEQAGADVRNLMIRLNKEISIKLDKISNEDLVKVVLPTKVFKHDKIFEVMSAESRIDY